MLLIVGNTRKVEFPYDIKLFSVGFPVYGIRRALPGLPTTYEATIVTISVNIRGTPTSLDPENRRLTSCQ